MMGHRQPRPRLTGAARLPRSWSGPERRRRTGPGASSLLGDECTLLARQDAAAATFDHRTASRATPTCLVSWPTGRCSTRWRRCAGPAKHCGVGRPPGPGDRVRRVGRGGRDRVAARHAGRAGGCSAAVIVQPVPGTFSPPPLAAEVTAAIAEGGRAAGPTERSPPLTRPGRPLPGTRPGPADDDLRGGDGTSAPLAPVVGNGEVLLVAAMAGGRGRAGLLCRTPGRPGHNWTSSAVHELYGLRGKITTRRPARRWRGPAGADGEAADREA